MGPCLCGDTDCPTCGTAQGTYRSKKVQFEVTVRQQSISITQETDVKKLQQLVRSNYQAYLKAIDRLKRARAQRDAVRGELERLKYEVQEMIKTQRKLNGWTE